MDEPIKLLRELLEAVREHMATSTHLTHRSREEWETNMATRKKLLDAAQKAEAFFDPSLTLRLIEEDECELMTFEEFQSSLKSNVISSDDGSAYYATETRVSDISVFGSPTTPVWATRIAWYNK